MCVCVCVWWGDDRVKKMEGKSRRIQRERLEGEKRKSDIYIYKDMEWETICIVLERVRG